MESFHIRLSLRMNFLSQKLSPEIYFCPWRKIELRALWKMTPSRYYFGQKGKESYYSVFKHVCEGFDRSAFQIISRRTCFEIVGYFLCSSFIVEWFRSMVHHRDRPKQCLSIARQSSKGESVSIQSLNELVSSSKNKKIMMPNMPLFDLNKDKYALILYIIPA